jgi:hypothetical protein
MEGGNSMTKSKREQEREWTVRKQEQNPHGKVKSLKDIAKDKK